MALDVSKTVFVRNGRVVEQTSFSRASDIGGVMRTGFPNGDLTIENWWFRRRTYRIHKAMLISGSKFFKDLLEDEPNITTIHLSADDDSFEAYLGYIYRGIADLPADTPQSAGILYDTNLLELGILYQSPQCDRVRGEEFCRINNHITGE